MSAAEKKTVFRIATALGTMCQRIAATVQSLILRKVKTSQYFLENSNEKYQKTGIITAW